MKNKIIKLQMFARKRKVSSNKSLEESYKMFAKKKQKSIKLQMFARKSRSIKLQIFTDYFVLLADCYSLLCTIMPCYSECILCRLRQFCHGFLTDTLL